MTSQPVVAQEPTKDGTWWERKPWKFYGGGQNLVMCTCVVTLSLWGRVETLKRVLFS